MWLARHRWYDPELGRWVSRDPIGYGGGDPNLYGYVGGTVTGMVDPIGLAAGFTKDPKYPEDVWAKMQHVHEHPGGAKTVIHYWENLRKGTRKGFKFK